MSRDWLLENRFGNAYDFGELIKLIMSFVNFEGFKKYCRVNSQVWKEFNPLTYTFFEVECYNSEFW